MSEKITIRRVENGCNLFEFEPETHSVGANLQSDSGPCIITFTEHKKDEIGNFNAAARAAFEEYCKGKDLTPRSKDLYSGKIALIDTKHENNEQRFGIAIYNVIDGTIPELCLLALSEDLRIEKDMTCSGLYKRVNDMYFKYNATNLFDKVMYVNGSKL